MRKTIIILLLAVQAITCAMTAQERQQAFFVYRNDSGLDVFFYNNVDSITCSKIDVDSTLHDEYVVQEVWTPDSVFRIPLTAIDSVAFKPLPTVYKEDVKVMDKKLEEYVIKIDSLTLCLNPDIPQSLIPQIGDKLVSTATSETIPNGFLGTVKNIDYVKDTIKINCDRLFIEDAFIQYFSIKTIDLYNIQEPTTGKNIICKSSGALQKEPITFTIPNWGLGLGINKKLTDHMSNVFGLSFENSLKITVTPIGTVQSSLILRPKSLIPLDVETDLTVSYINKSKVDWNWNLAGNLSGGREFSTGQIPFEIPVGGGANVYVEFGLGCSLEGQMAADFSLEQKIDASCFIKYNSHYPEGNMSDLKINEAKIIPNFKQINTVVGKVAGSVYVFFELGIDYLSKKFDRLGVKVQAGPKLELSIPIYIKETELSSRNTSSYKAMIADNNLLSLDLEAGASLEAYLFKDLIPTLDIGLSIPFWNKPLGNFYNKKFIPEFPITYFKHDKNGKNTIRTQISNDLVLPITIGTVVFDNESNEYQKILYGTKYQNQTSFSEYEIELNNLDLNKRYTAYPVIEWFGQTLLAEPSKDFSLSAIPVTVSAEDISTRRATLTGRIDGYEMLDEYCKYGFKYSNGSNPATGATVYGNLNADGSMTAELSGLQPETQYTFCAFVLSNGEYFYGKTMSFTTEEEIEAVDLGLSVKWRGWNLGANTPEEIGNYYAWGELTSKSDYTWKTYFDNPYNDADQWVGCTTQTDISGTELDAAKVELAKEWRMPTKDEMQELVDKCTWKWDDARKGYIVTGPSGKFIFLPAAGNADGTDISNKGSYGGYWTGTANTAGSNSQAANLYFFENTLHAVQWSNRYSGRSIRPVTP